MVTSRIWLNTSWKRPLITWRKESRRLMTRKLVLSMFISPRSVLKVSFFDRICSKLYDVASTKVIFTTVRAFSGRAKDVLPTFWKSLGVYEFTCGCGRIYVGKTIQRLSERINQHFPLKLLTRTARDRYDETSAVNQPLHDTWKSHQVVFLNNFCRTLRLFTKRGIRHTWMCLWRSLFNVFRLTCVNKNSSYDICPCFERYRRCCFLNDLWWQQNFNTAFKITRPSRDTLEFVSRHLLFE